MDYLYIPLQKKFPSLFVKNYLLYFIGQAISLCGTWMQTIGQGILVLQLTNSGTILGIITALQYLPIFLFGPFGGVIADKYPKKRLLYITQSLSGVLALILGVLVITHSITVWMIGILAFLLGLINTIDNPTRQTFLIELVGKEKLSNAILMNSSEVSLTRIIGPALAAILISFFNIGTCFLINAVSFGAVLLVLFHMDKKAIMPTPRQKTSQNELQQLKAGLRYVMDTPILRNTLILMAIIGTCTYEFQVSLPLLSQFTFHNTTQGYALLSSSMGFGAVLGGILLSGKKNPKEDTLIVSAAFLGVSLLLVAFSPTLFIAALAMIIAGLASINFIALANSTLQLESKPEMRGRVMSLWTMAFLGSTFIGGPIVGFIGQVFGPRSSLLFGALAAIFAAIGAFMITKKNIILTQKNISEAAEMETEKETRE